MIIKHIVNHHLQVAIILLFNRKPRPSAARYNSVETGSGQSGPHPAMVIFQVGKSISMGQWVIWVNTFDPCQL